MIATEQPSISMEKAIKVLHLEDSDADHLLVQRALSKSGLALEIYRADSQSGLQAVLLAQTIDIILMDYRLPGFTALDAWAEISKNKAAPPCVIVSGTIGEAAAVAAIQSGITDYLHKENLQELGRVVLRALKAHESEMERRQIAKALLVSERRITELARHLQTSLEQERASIAREIHDDIGGALAAIKLDTAWIDRHTKDEELLTRLSSIKQMVKQALTASQRIMLNTRPPILDQGLGASVQWLAEAHSKRMGRRVTLHCSLSAPNSLSDEFRLTAYRIVQETLTNASKYAPDADVRVDLSDEGGVLTVEVTDSGFGFDVAELANSSGFGLKGLSERAKSIGGWLDVSSTPGSGTSVTLTAPLPSPQTSQTDHS